MKKLFSLFVSVAIIIGTFAFSLSVNATSYYGWSAIQGTPTVSETQENGLIDFSVNASCSIATDEKFDMLKNSLVLRNLEISSGHWGYIGFHNESRKNMFKGDPQNGAFGFLLREQSGKLAVNVYTVNAGDYPLCTVPLSDEYIIGFSLNKGGKGSVVINGNSYSTSALGTEISNYCKSGKTSAYISLYAESAMSGSCRIDENEMEEEIDLGWDLVTADVDLSPSVDEGYVNFGVTAQGPAATVDKYDFLQNTIVIKNMQIPESYWGMLIFDTERRSGYGSSPVDGRLTILLRNTGKGTIQTAVFINNAEAQIANIEETDTYTFKFVPAGDDKYAIQINGTTFDNGYISSYCKSGKTVGYLHLFGQSSFKGSIKLGKLPLEMTSQNSALVPSLYIDGEDYLVTTAKEGVVLSTSNKIDLNTKSIILNDCKIKSKSKVDLFFGKNSVLSCEEANNLEDGILGILLYKNKDGNIEVNKNDVLLETVKSANNYEIGFVKQSNDVWALKINDTVISDNDFDEFIDEEKTEAFISLKSDKTISFKYTVANTEWFANAKTGVAEVNVNTVDNYDINLNGDGFVISAQRYNPIYTDATVNASKLDVDDELHFQFSIKKPTKISNKMTDTLIPLYLKRLSQSTYEFGIFNGKGEKVAFKTFDSTVEYKIGFVYEDDKYVPAVNGESIDVSDAKFDDIKNGLNQYFSKMTAAMSYFIFESVPKAEFSLNIFVREKPVEEVTGWKYYSSTGTGSLNGDETSGYTQNSTGAMYAFSNKTYDPTKTAVKITVDSLKEWFYLSLSATDMSDTNVLPAGNNVKRVVFIITPQSNNTMARFSYWNMNGKSVESPIDVKTFDWSAEHTYSIELGTDEHWHLVVDSVIMQGITSPVLDTFMEEYAEDGVHFGVGSFGQITSHGINVVERGTIDNKINEEAWGYFSTFGNGTMNGNDEDGYGVYLESGDLYGISKKAYDVNKTALQFKITDVRNWIWFSLSKTDVSDSTVLTNDEAQDANRVVFIITPKLSAIQAQFSIWHDKRENVMRTINFDWYTNDHTLDVRKAGNGHWYLTIDGKMIQNQISEYLDTFMELNSTSELYYGIGGNGCFGAEDIKVVEKPAEKEWGSSDDGDDLSDGSMFDFDEEIDFGFNYDEELDVDYFEYDMDSEIDDQIKAASKQYQKIWKRKLVKRGHGIIFNVWEWIAMIGGGVVFISGVVFLVIFLIKKKKGKKIPQKL